MSTVDPNQDSNFVRYIESSFSQRGIRADMLFLGLGLTEEFVVRRQMVEGVVAIMKVDRLSQAVQRFHLTVFDRSQGGHNVKYDGT